MNANDDPKQESTNHVLDVLRSFDTCILTTLTDDGLLHARPMAIARVDHDGHIALLTSIETEKVQEIARDEHVSLACQGNAKFACARGTALLVRDKARIHAVWKPSFSAWFKDGENDPNIVLVDVEIERAEVWDQSGWKGVVGLFERARAAVTRDTPDLPEGSHEVVDIH